MFIKLLSLSPAVILPLLQRQAGEAAAITANKRRKLENILETKIGKDF